MKKLNFKINPFVLSIFIVLLFVGCSDDDNGGSGSPTPSTFEIVFKAEASAGSTLNTCTFGYDSTLTSASSIGGTTWSSTTITAPSNATIATVSMNAIGNNSSSTLKVQIYVNGILKKEAFSTGTALAAIAQYNLN